VHGYPAQGRYVKDFRTRAVMALIGS